MGDIQQTNFATAMAAFEARRAEDLDYDRSMWQPAYHASKEAGGPAIFYEVDKEMDRLIGLRCDAEDELITTPAPALPEAIWKLEYTRTRWEMASEWPDDWWDAIMSDRRCIAATGGGPAT